MTTSVQGVKGEKMICPFRIERCMALTIPNEFYDNFRSCIKESCPCYRAVGEEAWCYRDLISHPLNEMARRAYERREDGTD